MTHSQTLWATAPPLRPLYVCSLTRPSRASAHCHIDTASQLTGAQHQSATERSATEPSAAERWYVVSASSLLTSCVARCLRAADPSDSDEAHTAKWFESTTSSVVIVLIVGHSSGDSSLARSCSLVVCCPQPSWCAAEPLSAMKMSLTMLKPRSMTTRSKVSKVCSPQTRL